MTKTLQERASAIVDQTIQSEAFRLNDKFGRVAPLNTTRIAALDTLICATQEAARRADDEPAQRLMEALGLGLGLRNKASWITARDMEDLQMRADNLHKIVEEITADWNDYADEILGGV